MPIPVVLVVVVAVAVLVTAWLLRRSSRSTTTTSAEAEARPDFPPAGLLVPEDVLRSAGSSSAAIWDALEAAVAPVAVEYHPVSESEVAKFRTVPVNAAAQQAMVGIVEALDPKSPTLFRVVLPKGAELVKAVGTSGFRGFSRSGGTTAHAVLKPVAAGGAVVAGWPALAVAGTVLAIDMVTQREQRAHQRRIEAALDRQEERHYVERIKDQRSADTQLSRAISLMLDGHKPDLELAMKSAYDEFHRSQQFLEKHRGVIDGLVEDDGKVDYRRLEEALGGRTKETDHFVRELHLARAAIAIRRKAMLADAAAVALADPANPYAALRKFLESQVHQLEDADAAATELTERLTQIELKGRWHDFDNSVAAKQEQLRARISPPEIDGDTEIRYVVTSSREILQILPPDEDEPAQDDQDDQDTQDNEDPQDEQTPGGP
ncbi:hypothetical protein OOK31_01865 [Streptomyces sp. NBC_00249]|uniref:hypothetical protein n=1 Tax=Streptomyces sp. NBC_00249 TaxID=2975690 RepID=UPI0022541A1A|nr:hypothetical protein [Streptomyces sp. NBC_00249]MCX5192648.1 hypothetical protein [Streptomyces sp. NBC_00249]